MFFRCQKPFASDMNIVTFLSECLCVCCVFTQKNTHNIFEYEYCNVPQFFKNDRFLEAMGSVCEYWFAEWAHKKDFIKMSVKDILEADKSSGEPIFATREKKEMLA